MAHQYLNDGDEKEVRSQPADDPERNDVPHEDSAAEAASHRAEESSSTHAAASRSRRNKSEDTIQPDESHADGEQENAVVAPKKDDIQTLEELGFTRDEATRLIDVSVRINGATLKRLQFTKWLVEQGLLDEFSVRD